jgi:hypothetical protein
VAALNDAVTEHSIAPEQIVSVLAVAGQGLVSRSRHGFVCFLAAIDGEQQRQGRKY